MSKITNTLNSMLPKSLLKKIKPVYRYLRYSPLGKWQIFHKTCHNLGKLHSYDAKRFAKYAILTKCEYTRASLSSEILLHSHCIEKGLSLSKPRLRFGQQHISIVLNDLSEYVPQYGFDHASMAGLDALFEYCSFHRKNNVYMENLESSLNNLISSRSDYSCDSKLGGSFSITREEIHSVGKIDIELFLKSRHSIRHFDSRPIEDDLIRKAVSLATTTPSVCNRQMWRARVYRDPGRKKAILELQTGNRGFGEQIDTLFLITCDLQYFYSINEKNEAWVNGGMFTMTLLLALHSLGLGACCLNWSVDINRDMKLRQITNIPDEETIVTIIAAGNIPEKLSVAHSSRKPVEDILFQE